MLEPEELDEVANQASWLGAYAVEVIRSCSLADFQAQDLERGNQNSSIEMSAHMQV